MICYQSRKCFYLVSSTQTDKVVANSKSRNAFTISDLIVTIKFGKTDSLENSFLKFWKKSKVFHTTVSVEEIQRLILGKVFLCHRDYFRVRLNYATTHHHPPPPTTSQNISTTTHRYPPPAKIYPPPPTTTNHYPKCIYHHPPPAKIHRPLPTTSQKMDHHPAEAKIYSHITSFWHWFNSFFFFEMHYCFPRRRFCVTKFWSVRFSSSKFVLTFRSSHRRWFCKNRCS